MNNKNKIKEYTQFAIASTITATKVYSDFKEKMKEIEGKNNHRDFIKGKKKKEFWR